MYIDIDIGRYIYGVEVFEADHKGLPAVNIIYIYNLSIDR